MTKTRAYSFTLNNYQEDIFDYLEAAFSKGKIRYLIAGKEIAPKTGTPHIQGYIYYHNQVAFSTFKKMIGKKAHIETSKGSPDQNEIYCKKEGNYIELGDKPEQGKRSDLNKVKDDIIKNGLKVDDICVNDPMFYHQYGRTLHKIEDIAQRKKYRKEMTTCDWYYGGTGIGKSHKAFENFDPDTHYVWSLRDKGWQDGYTGQETVIINDFRGEIPYNALLDLIDKYWCEVSRRNRMPMPFTSKHIIITSSLKPEQIFKNREKEDKIEQLMRRIKVYTKDKQEDEWKIIVEGDNEPEEI